MSANTGTSVMVKAEFARYLSMLECFQCRDGILLRAAAYAGAREKRGDEAAFIAEDRKALGHRSQVRRKASGGPE